MDTILTLVMFFDKVTLKEYYEIMVNKEASPSMVWNALVRDLTHEYVDPRSLGFKQLVRSGYDKLERPYPTNYTRRYRTYQHDRDNDLGITRQCTLALENTDIFRVLIIPVVEKGRNQIPLLVHSRSYADPLGIWEDMETLGIWFERDLNLVGNFRPFNCI